MSEQLLTIFTQFGAAGLIGLMWIVERRSGALRERQLCDAHRQVMSRERELDALLAVVKDNTRAINAVEHTQRQLLSLVQKIAAQADGRTASSRAPGRHPGLAAPREERAGASAAVSE